MEWETVCKRAQLSETGERSTRLMQWEQGHLSYTNVQYKHACMHPRQGLFCNEYCNLIGHVEVLELQVFISWSLSAQCASYYYINFAIYT